MAFPLFSLKQYLSYQAEAKNAHGLHSPFLYHLYQDLIKKGDDPAEKALLQLRKIAFHNSTLLQFNDPKSGEANAVKAGQLARRVASQHRFSRFLKRLIDDQNYQRVLETGTSTGINTTYLAHSQARSIISIEGAPEIAEFAQRRFTQLNLTQIEVVSGKIQETFIPVLHQLQPDFIFLDADHRGITIDFYMESIARHSPDTQCIVIHDIHWSADMNQCWKRLIQQPEYTLTIDLFQAGLIFPHYPMEKQHFTVRF